MYLIIFLVGAVGFFAMSALGFMHSVGHHGGGAHGPRLGHGGHLHLPHLPGHGHGTAHAPAGHGQAGHAPATQGSSAQSGHAGHVEVPSPAFQNFVMTSASILSPLNIFSLCLGFGATGILLGKTLGPTILLLAAMLGALAFHFGVMRQVMNLVFKFESKPSEGLEGAVAKIAEAATPFDKSGKGVVKLLIDGQVVQLLATLDASELQHGTSVSRGDQVIVIDVDPSRNTCRVTRELGQSGPESKALPRSDQTC